MKGIVTGFSSSVLGIDRYKGISDDVECEFLKHNSAVSNDHIGLDVAAGDEHTCAITRYVTANVIQYKLLVLYCFGRNHKQQLGIELVDEYEIKPQL